MTIAPTPCAILDLLSEANRLPERLVFAEPLCIWRADSVDRVVEVIDEAERAARGGQWVVGFVSFEAASAFDPAFEQRGTVALPLAWFAAFAMPAAATHHGRASFKDDRPPEPIDLAPETTMPDARYADAVRRIHEYIAAGDVYQVNLTVPYTAPRRAPARAIYEQMRHAQGGAYSALIDIGDAQILSASPELFFERRGDRIRSRPMKGTAPRGLHPAADDSVREELERSEKERAENVMIVDVVRNDLGRIATLGSVSVDALCSPERYPSVWQLASSVEAELRPELPLSEIFRALFPPASVTGAPKIRATAIIREIESLPREVYCGAVGVLRPGGDATFNVAIRTAWTMVGSDTLHLHAGGGVTADSTARGELREVGTKLRAFTHLIETPALFETIRVERGVAIRLERHLSRLAASADRFGIRFDRLAALAVLEDAIARAEHVELLRARLELAPDGTLTAWARVHQPELPSGLAPVAFASAPVDRRDLQLYHKCTDRTRYETALREAPGMFDVVLWNDEGEATELTRGNLVVELHGRRLTPPMDCGLLGGTLRAELLERGGIEERVVSIDDVRSAERLWFVNSLRGWVPIALPEAERRR